jgi:hypothetical protein
MKIQKFNSFIKESEEQEGDPLSPEGSRLRELGLAPNLDWDERYDLILKEWEADPEIEKAYTFLRKKVEVLVEKYMTDEDHEEDSDFLQWIEYILNHSVSDVGMLEYLIVGETT